MRVSILVIILLFSFKSFSQKEKKYEYKFIQRNIIDSLLKMKNYKEGDTLSLKIHFKVDNEGLTQVFRIDTPDEIFENEAIAILKKMEPFNIKYHNNKYELPINYKIKFSDVKYQLFNTLNSDLPDNNIWSIEVDKDGNKWIGTGKKGLVKMNGSNWKIFNKENSIIKGFYISPLFCDNSNNIWLTHSKPDALLKFDGNKWKQLPKSITKLRQSPIKIVEDNKGNLYLGGFNELVKYDGKNWNKIALPKGNFTIRAIAVDNDGTIAVGHNNGMIIKRNGKWKFYRVKKNENKLQNYVRSLKYLKKGKLFIGYGGNLDGGFSILENENWTHYNKKNSKLSNNMVRDIEIDKNGNLWLATNDGLNKVDLNGKITPIYFYEGNNITMIADIAVEGNVIWVATSFGLIKIEQ